MTLYIDPGTGSMLFTILIGVIGAAIYSLRMLLIKIRFKLSGGKVEMNADEIPFGCTFCKISMHKIKKLTLLVSFLILP